MSAVQNGQRLCLTLLIFQTTQGPYAEQWVQINLWVWIHLVLVINLFCCPLHWLLLSYGCTQYNCHNIVSYKVTISTTPCNAFQLTNKNCVAEKFEDSLVFRPYDCITNPWKTRQSDVVIHPLLQWTHFMDSLFIYSIVNGCSVNRKTSKLYNTWVPDSWCNDMVEVHMTICNSRHVCHPVFYG